MSMNESLHKVSNHYIFLTLGNKPIEGRTGIGSPTLSQKGRLRYRRADWYSGDHIADPQWSPLWMWSPLARSSETFLHSTTPLTQFLHLCALVAACLEQPRKPLAGYFSYRHKIYEEWLSFIFKKKNRKTGWPVKIKIPFYLQNCRNYKWESSCQSKLKSTPCIVEGSSHDLFCSCFRLRNGSMRYVAQRLY